MVSMEATELELGVPSGEEVPDGEWVLAIFELGSGRRATSAAGRALVAPDGTRLVFEPRDWQRLADFAQVEARRGGSVSQPPVRPSGSLPASTPPGARSSSQSSMRAPTSARVLVIDDDA